MSPGASDASGGDHEVVEVSLLNLSKRDGGPILLQVHRVNAVVAIGADPIDSGALRVETIVDPILKHAVVGIAVVQLHVDFDAQPLPDVGRAEQGSLPACRAEPA